MRIGVDARALVGPENGIKNYLHSIITCIECKTHIFVLYIPSCLPVDKCYIAPHIEIRSFDIKSKFIQFCWYNFKLASCLVSDNIDCFWAPAHRLPLIYRSEIPSLVTIHDLVWKRAPRTMRLYGYLMDLLLTPMSIRRADKITAISTSTARDIKFFYPNCYSKVKCIPLFSKFGIDEVYNNSGSQYKNPYILVVGTIEPRKNLIRFVKAFINVPESVRKDAKILIVGKRGWISKADYEFLESSNKYLSLIGVVDDTELSNLYRNALFLAMPSLYEGFGLPIIEALSHGTPILTSSVSSMPEVAGDAANYIDPLSVESITDGLTRMLGDSKYLQSLRMAARSRSYKFSIKYTVSQTIDMFEGFFSEKNAG